MIGIQVVSWAGRPPNAPTTAWFGAEGGDIGRSAECTLPLPDPERHISRRHAVVVQRQGRYFLQALSAGVPVTIDGAPLDAGDESALVAGMEIGVGAYTLQVLDEPESLGGTSRPQPPARPAVPPAPLAEALARPPVPPAEAPARPPVPKPPWPAQPEVDLLVGETGDTPVSSDVAAPAAAPAHDLVSALKRGLGVDGGVGPAIGPDEAQRIGALLRAMTGGTLDLLTARMVAKRELGAAATQLRTRENNPLKFSPDVDAALSHLIGPPERGFLDPQTAVREAFDDLRAHQVALLAGMRAALESVMSRFDPEALEKRLAPGGALENLIPANRRARLWSSYSDEYARIVSEIEDDFDALLGRAFLKAYQAQLQALAADRRLPEAE
ncbi:MAG: type VI secretion system-associated FHA domain protein TagH [Burkholderiaceae bacterium]|nr:type VI secretion system-associated FHA domain protein TagH [Burkholderiaceae bacterium]